MRQQDVRFLRRRKMMLVMPLIIMPMLALAFFALGGGKGTGGHTGSSSGKGLNMSLPEVRVNPKEKVLNKLGFYKRADQDSVKLMERRKQDPYYHQAPADTGWRLGGAGRSGGGLTGLGPGGSAADVQAEELTKKLDQLKAVLRGQEQGGVLGQRPGSPYAGLPERDNPNVPGALPGDAVPRSIGQDYPGARPGGVQGDPDLDRLNTMLDKVLKIQHPEAGDTVRQALASGRSVGLLTGRRPEEVVKTLGGTASEDTGQVLVVGSIPGPGGRASAVEDGLGSGFIDLDAGTVMDSSAENAVSAVVARDQTLVSGASVELRLDEEAVINGVAIQRGSPVWGKASLSGERLLVTVSSIRQGSRVIPVSLEVYDLDGMPGFRERGSIDRDAAKESAGEAVNTLGMTSVDPSLGGQAAAAGIQAARTLLGRKVRLAQVGLVAGYHVLLRNSKSVNH